MSKNAFDKNMNKWSQRQILHYIYVSGDVIKKTSETISNKLSNRCDKHEINRIIVCLDGD